MVYVLIGGTGTLGLALTDVIRREEPEARIRLMARGEHRMAEVMEFLGTSPNLSYIIGDVRDERRLETALHDADVVFMMAALKHVNSCEYNVLEAVQTNIVGSSNVVRACVRAGVKRAVLVSTDKAVEPLTTYGATKMVAERIFIYGNAYAGGSHPVFSVVRYGNVLGSNGSVVSRWLRQRRLGEVTVSDPSFTRFWWTPAQAARFVYEAVKIARPGDVLVPQMYACSLGQLAQLVAPGCRWCITKPYATEKPHEVLLAANEVDKTTLVEKPVLAARVSYLLPPPDDEMRWPGSQMCSAECVDVEKVSLCLSDL